MKPKYCTAQTAGPPSLARKQAAPTWRLARLIAPRMGQELLLRRAKSQRTEPPAVVPLPLREGYGKGFCPLALSTGPQKKLTPPTPPFQGGEKGAASASCSPPLEKGG